MTLPKITRCNNLQSRYSFYNAHHSARPLRDALARQIKQGLFPPGAQLLTGLDLGVQFGVNRDSKKFNGRRLK